MKPTVKVFQDDIGLLNELKKQSSKGVPKDNLYVVAHDDQRTDCIVGDADARLKNIGDLVGECDNETGDEFQTIFRRLGFDPDEVRDLEAKLDNGKILLLIT